MRYVIERGGNYAASVDAESLEEAASQAREFISPSTGCRVVKEEESRRRMPVGRLGHGANPCPVWAEEGGRTDRNRGLVP